MAINKEIGPMWDVIQEFKQVTTESGVFYEHRREQTVNWVHDMVNEHLRARFCKHPEIVRIMPDVEKAVAEGSLPAVAAVRKLISSFHGVQS